MLWYCYAGRVVSLHSVACYLSFCSQGEVCLSMIAVSVCHTCDAAVYGCLVVMYFIPRERCWLEGGCVHSTPRVISLVMLMSFFAHIRIKVWWCFMILFLHSFLDIQVGVGAVLTVCCLSSVVLLPLSW